MATIEQITKKNGETIYKITVSNGRGRRVKRTWKPNSSWSQRTTERELRKFAAQLENEFAAA